VTPAEFKIAAFEENGKIVLFPIVPGDNVLQEIYVLPIYEIEDEDTKKIGDMIIEVTSFINMLLCGEKVIEEAEAKTGIPKALGHSSWSKVKKHMNRISIWRGNPDVDTHVLTFTPMHPHGKTGASYVLKDVSYRKYASIDDPSAMGQALVDTLLSFKK